MAKLAISKDFLADYRKLEAVTQKLVDKAFTKFEQHTHAGLHLERMHGSTSAYTIRIDQNFRGIVLKPSKGDSWVLVRVLPHDKAYEWLDRNTVDVNAATGALEVYDSVAVESTAASLVTAGGGRADADMFGHCSTRDFKKLGVPDSIVPVIQKLHSEDELFALTNYMPKGQADALHGLAAGLTPEEIWKELVGEEEPGQIDTEDVATAIERPASQSSFHVVDGAEGYIEVLSRPFDEWCTFLHPTQEKLAYRPQYSGPVRVTGGAGTGKTVVAMHRAKCLAESSTTPGKPILFTTFTKNLAETIASQLQTLGGPDLVNRVDVTNVDALAVRIVREVEGESPKIAMDDIERRAWEDIVDEEGLAYSASFLQQEWHQVVLSQRIGSRNEYFSATRAGRGVRLSRRERVDVWKAIERFLARLRNSGQRTFLQLADDAAAYMEGRAVRPYEHVIVDEAQDLHPAQWRLLRSVVAEKANDIFLVGDTHQRIYDNRVSLGQVGIKIVGRSHQLRLNYRTSHEILRWSLGLLDGNFDDLDGGEDTLAGYRSVFHGPKPEVEGFASTREELDSLVESIRGWMKEGVEPESVGVAARTGSSLDGVDAALKQAGIPTVRLSGRETQSSELGVRIGTMHRMKGLEFRGVAVVDCGRNEVPLASAVPPASVDQAEHDYALLRERCLLYVACSRAREYLRVSWHGAPSSFVDALGYGESSTDR